MYPNLTNRDDVLQMLYEMTAARQKILDACGKLSDDQLKNPVYAGTWSVLKTMAHLAWAESLMVASVKCRPAPLNRDTLAPETPLELAAIRTALDEAHAEAIAYLKANSEAILKEPCLFGRKNSEETVGGVYFHIIEHEIGHRAFIQHKLAKLQS